MRIRCEHFDSKTASFTCPTCRHYQRCTLLEPTNKNHSTLLREINFWLKQLQDINRVINEYTLTFDRINNNEFTIPVNVYGNIQYAPKQNAFGVFIRKPEHVYYGWNHEKLQNKKDDLLKYLRLLNRKELNMRKILERRSCYGV